MNCAYKKAEMHRQFLRVSSFPTGHGSENHSPSEGVCCSFVGMGSELLTLVIQLWGKNKLRVVGLCLLGYFWIYFSSPCLKLSSLAEMHGLLSFVSFRQGQVTFSRSLHGSIFPVSALCSGKAERCCHNFRNVDKA